MIEPENEVSPSDQFKPLIQRYFTQLDNEGSYADYQKAAMDLILASHFIETDDTEALLLIFDAVHAPDEDDQWDILHMKDEFIIFPLRTFAPHVEATMNVREVLNWYDVIVSYVLEKSSKYLHGIACLESTESNDECGLSQCCPWRYVAHKLSKEVMNQDFEHPEDTLEYAVYGPSHHRDVERGKIHLGLQFNLFEATDYDKTTKKYDAFFVDNFPDETSKA